MNAETSGMNSNGSNTQRDLKQGYVLSSQEGRTDISTPTLFHAGSRGSRKNSKTTSAFGSKKISDDRAKRFNGAIPTGSPRDVHCYILNYMA